MKTGPPPSPATDRDRLTDLARRIERLVPSHRDPELFFERRCEIADELRRLAGVAGGRRDDA